MTLEILNHYELFVLQTNSIVQGISELTEF